MPNLFKNLDLTCAAVVDGKIVVAVLRDNDDDKGSLVSSSCCSKQDDDDDEDDEDSSSSDKDVVVVVEDLESSESIRSTNLNSGKSCCWSSRWERAHRFFPSTGGGGW